MTVLISLVLLLQHCTRDMAISNDLKESERLYIVSP